MLFNSLSFALFLPIVFFLYWVVFKNKLKRQNLLIVFASYLFYGWWDWRFLSLILFSTIVDFFIGNQLSVINKNSTRKLLLLLSLIVNLGLLGFFKYYNFFLENLIEAFASVNISFNTSTLKIILPVGISFYTFQTLSYTIDVYRKKLEPTKDFIAFTAFVSFFPQLVAGPIERATNLLPQFYKKRKFNVALAYDGMRQILWGLFKKVVIADSCAEYVNIIFNNSSEYSGSTLFIGAIFFAFQIYGDFSGYSDIAIGTARLFGFNLMQNFAFPYFSRDIAEFWRRWHISLSTWFRDYLYIPLGGSRGGTGKKIRNTFAIFLVSGFWHGANWTFLFWGFLNALYFLPLLLAKTNRTNLNVVAENRVFPTLIEVRKILTTFTLTVLAWIFFRAENITHAFEYILGIFSKSFFTVPEFSPVALFILLILFLILEWQARDKKFALEDIHLKVSSVPRMLLYSFLIFCILTFTSKQEFIYFQF